MAGGATTRVTESTSGGPTRTHLIGMRGITGAMFWCLMTSLVLYVIAFATPGWQSYNKRMIGLWDSCQCGIDVTYTNDAWFAATQAMITIGLILLVVAFVILVVYMWIHSVNKTQTLLAFIICSGCVVLFALIGYIVFGAETAKSQNGGGNLSYSYIISVIAICFCLAATVLALWQWRQSTK